LSFGGQVNGTTIVTSDWSSQWLQVSNSDGTLFVSAA
jgi:hypothetical protein